MMSTLAMSSSDGILPFPPENAKTGIAIPRRLP
jgi:hypothetical protein